MDMLSTDILVTDRLALSTISESDLSWLQSLMAHPEVMQFSLKGPLTPEETREVIYRDAIDSYAAHGFGHWACYVRDTMQPIGICGLTVKTVDECQVYELGYRLFVDFWGQGFGTEACRAVKEYAFKVLKLPKIISIIEPLNTRSVRVAQKNGILYERATLYRGISVGIYSAYNTLTSRQPE